MDKCIVQMGQDLAFAEYAESTREAYLKTAMDLAGHVQRPVAEVDREDLRGYVEHLRARGRSASWLKMKLAALVFLFAKTLGRPTDVSFIVWPKQYSPLPTVLSPKEIAALLEALQQMVYCATTLTSPR